ncbi:MAG: hypothetical protein ACFFER_19660, partial [Candidatus Thorarchaeota archaeon]
AKQKNLTGIIMMHALLKAEYLIARGVREDAIDTLKDALLDEYSDTARTLYERVRNKLVELQTL